ncbi:MAG: mannose-1-phosphate guanyltransferase [Bdellovibrio sp. ArHS]|uniref:sugar phosphate nucleotidyltransferase n=1 Tax=Bdellovibrio sp. ArHS TaxID=1569284 RepID=UPI0005829C0A|nr:sugar phosphate nucleotidyltransferase [Bdellovibrio sp. ArHS]KHD88059.1 MAG: mannose-1-phosphate guanyltransferase [Bdellovibrio sp. ArHS]
MNVMLLAAGEGTRLRPYTTVLPKPAIPFLTIPLAAHALGFLREIKIEKLVVNTFHLPKKIHELFHRLPHKAESLHFSNETGAILGSGGGLGQARAHFQNGGDFIMMNADEVILPQDPSVLAKAIDLHSQTKALGTLLVMDHPGVGSQFGGVWTDAQNNVLGFGKQPIPGSAKAWHFVGVQILSEEVFSFIPLAGESNILYDALTVAIQKGFTVKAFPFQCSWFETGNPGDFLEASKKCFSYLASTEDSFQKRALTANIQEYAPKPVHITLEFGGQRMISDGAKIDISSHIEGFFCIGSGSSVASGCHLENVIVGDGVQVSAGTKASNTFFLEDV